MIAPRDAQSYALLGCAASLALLYASGAALGMSNALMATIAIVLLALPAVGVWRGRGRDAFWYALTCTWIVAHALWLAADTASRPLGLALLVGAGALFVIACAFVRRRGLAAS